MSLAGNEIDLNTVPDIADYNAVSGVSSVCNAVGAILFGSREQHEYRQLVRKFMDGDVLAVPVLLGREPTNPADKNAVHVGLPGKPSFAYLPKDVAAVIGPMIDEHGPDSLRAAAIGVSRPYPPYSDFVHEPLIVMAFAPSMTDEEVAALVPTTMQEFAVYSALHLGKMTPSKTVYRTDELVDKWQDAQT